MYVHRFLVVIYAFLALNLSVKNSSCYGIPIRDDCDLPQNLIDEIASYADVTQRIIDYVTEGPRKGLIWRSLADFVDQFGPRYTGTAALENAIDYLIDIFNQNGLEDIHTEDIEVPYWIRGDESVTLLRPREKKMPMLGLGLSIATPPDGITAEAIIVRNFEELESLPAGAVDGKILVFNQPFTFYGESGRYRLLGAVEAAKKGAIAALIRSVTPFSLASPHTGILTYENNVTQIPAASITVEDAELLWRIQERGEEIIIRLNMPAVLENKVSRHTFADLKGSTKEDNIVIVAGHIDSWDITDGAMDNGGGSFIAWLSPMIMQELGLRPARTVRTIMWTAEEVGINGYEDLIQKQRANDEFINFILDSDLGAFKPKGVSYQGSKTGECIMREVLKLFESINATEIEVQSRNQKQAQPLAEFNIPFVGLLNANEKYFWFHHTPADTITVLNSEDLDLSSAFWAAFSYVVADLSIDIPRE